MIDIEEYTKSEEDELLFLDIIFHFDDEVCQMKHGAQVPCTVKAVATITSCRKTTPMCEVATKYKMEQITSGHARCSGCSKPAIACWTILPL